MSNVAQGPGWWQGTDGKWYSPEVQPAPAPTAVTGGPTGGGQSAFCSRCGAAGEAGFQFCGSCGAPMAAPAPAPNPNLDSVQRQLTSIQGQLQGFRMKMTATTWLLLVGSVVAVVSSFFPWVSGTIDDGFGSSYSETLGMNGTGKFVMIAFVVAIITLCWPAFSGRALSVKRTVGLTVLVGVLTLLALLFTAAGGSVGRSNGLSHASPAFGVFLCWIGIAVIWVGVIRVWIKRRDDQVVTA